MRGPITSNVPATSRAPSNTTIPGTEKREWAPCTAGRLRPSSSSPTAVSTIPPHWRREIFSPNERSATTASITTPPASTAWTVDSGATAIAATWNTQAPVATRNPIANSLEENSCRAVRNGCLMSTAGAWQAPRCLYRKPTLVESAHASANAMPRIRLIDRGISRGS